MLRTTTALVIVLVAGAHVVRADFVLLGERTAPEADHLVVCVALGCQARERAGAADRSGAVAIWCRYRFRLRSARASFLRGSTDRPTELARHLRERHRFRRHG